MHGQCIVSINYLDLVIHVNQYTGTNETTIFFRYGTMRVRK